MAGIRVASGPVSAVRREFLTLAKVTWVVPRMTAHTYAGLLSDHKWTIGQWWYGKEDCCIDRWAGNGRGAHTIVHEVFRLFRFRRPDTPPDRGGVLTISELLWRRRPAMRGSFFTTVRTRLVSSEPRRPHTWRRSASVVTPAWSWVASKQCSLLDQQRQHRPQLR